MNKEVTRPVLKIIGKQFCHSLDSISLTGISNMNQQHFFTKFEYVWFKTYCIDARLLYNYGTDSTLYSKLLQFLSNSGTVKNTKASRHFAHLKQRNFPVVSVSTFFIVSINCSNKNANWLSMCCPRIARKTGLYREVVLTHRFILCKKYCCFVCLFLFFSRNL